MEGLKQIARLDGIVHGVVVQINIEAPSGTTFESTSDAAWSTGNFTQTALLL